MPTHSLCPSMLLDGDLVKKSVGLVSGATEFAIVATLTCAAFAP
ncbi:MAG: hypothetical protein U0934_05685 [Pseudotabrizicola sp.]|nr:hypothetical protein [Pseudotabrizicola sp.]MDP2081044.1 hypothetical protein [Pseudotabrizicola sp.]MDZ7573432.1 hypothetical protein [Pseudotabrizicola sp.]